MVINPGMHLCQQLLVRLYQSGQKSTLHSGLLEHTKLQAGDSAHHGRLWLGGQREEKQQKKEGQGMQAAEEVPEHEEEDGSEQEAEKEEEQKFAHMALVEPVDLPTGKSEKIMKLKEKILHFKKAAQRKVIWQLTVIITLLKD